MKEGAAWKLASWQIANGGLAAEREEWNGKYRERPTFDVKPNRLLVDTLKDRGPGTALDLMMGQGRNALYLASKGWTTTGVDLSDEGVLLAREAASKQKLKLETFSAEGERAPGTGGAAKGEIAAHFRVGFHILRDQTVEDVADWGTKTKLVRFVAQKK